MKVSLVTQAWVVKDDLQPPSSFIKVERNRHAAEVHDGTNVCASLVAQHPTRWLSTCNTPPLLLHVVDGGGVQANEDEMKQEEMQNGPKTQCHEHA